MGRAQDIVDEIYPAAAESIKLSMSAIDPELPGHKLAIQIGMDMVASKLLRETTYLEEIRLKHMDMIRRLAIAVDAWEEGTGQTIPTEDILLIIEEDLYRLEGLDK